MSLVVGDESLSGYLSSVGQQPLVRFGFMSKDQIFYFQRFGSLPVRLSVMSLLIHKYSSTL